MSEKKQSFELVERESSNVNEEEAPSQEKSEKPSFGAYFSELLKTKNVSIDTVFEETRIQKKYLIALQNDKFEVFDAPVLIKGFLRSIANALDIPQGEIISHYEAYLHAQEEKGEGFNKTADQPPRDTPVRPILTALFFLFILFLVIGLFKLFVPSTEKTPQAEITPVEKATHAPAVTPSPTPLAVEKEKPKQAALLSTKNVETKKEENVAVKQKTTKEPVARTTNAKSSAPASVETPEKSKKAERLTVRFYSLNRSWVQVAADNRPPSNFFINSKSSPIIYANEKVVIQMGNVSSTELYVNGKNIALPHNASDVVRNLTITPENIGTFSEREKPLDRSKAVAPENLPPLAPPETKKETTSTESAITKETIAETAGANPSQQRLKEEATKSSKLKPSSVTAPEQPQ